MNIYLIRSEELSKDRFRKIFDLINKKKGTVVYKAQPEDLKFEEENEKKNSEKLEVKTWESMFLICEKHRKTHNYGKNKILADDVVVLLTDHPNELDWFSSWLPGDTGNRRNFFVQTSMWESFVEWNNFTLSDSRYTIVYELISIPLYLSLFETNKDLVNAAHLTKMEWGCPLDMCEDKRDVLRKYHSGDVCPRCKQLMEEKKIDPFLANQFFETIRTVRELFLLKERLWCLRSPSKLKLDLVKQLLVFTDLADFPLYLPAREWALYNVLINHPEVSDFSQLKDYKDEIYELYRPHSSEKTITEIKNTSDSIISDKKVFTEIVSRINKRIKRNLDRYLRHFYIIHGDARKKISYEIKIDRQLVTIKN